MNANLEKDMKKLVAEHMPEMVAKQMKEFIEQAELNKSLLTTAKEKNAELTKEVEALKKLQLFEFSLNDRETALNARQKDLDEREHKLDMKILEVKLEMETASNAKVMGLVDKVFGHPRVTINNSKIRNWDEDDPQYPGNTKYRSDNTSETITKTEDKE